MTSRDHLDLQLAACGLSLDKDLDNSFILRVTYSGCLVKQQVRRSLSLPLYLSPLLIVFHSSHVSGHSQDSSRPLAWCLILHLYRGYRSEWEAWTELSAVASQYFCQLMVFLSLSCLISIDKFGWLLSFNTRPCLLRGCFSSTATMSWHLTLWSGGVVMEADPSVFWWSVRWRRRFPAEKLSSATRSLFRLAISQWWSCNWVCLICHIQRCFYVCRWRGNFLVTTGIMR